MDKTKTITYWIGVFVILTIIGIGIGNVFISMEKTKIRECEEVEQISDKKGEDYFECLQQNDLDSWDMNNQKIYFRLQIAGALFVTYLIGGILSFFVMIALDDTWVLNERSN